MRESERCGSEGESEKVEGTGKERKAQGQLYENEGTRSS